MKHEIEYYPNGNKKHEFYYNDLGQFHNEVGPAAIVYDENENKLCESYYLNEKIHNIKGPALIYLYQNEVEHKEYWVNDFQVFVDSDEELLKYIKLLNIS